MKDHTLRFARYGEKCSIYQEGCKQGIQSHSDAYTNPPPHPRRRSPGWHDGSSRSIGTHYPKFASNNSGLLEQRARLDSYSKSGCSVTLKTLRLILRPQRPSEPNTSHIVAVEPSSKALLQQHYLLYPAPSYLHVHRDQISTSSTPSQDSFPGTPPPHHGPFSAQSSEALATLKGLS